MTMKQKKERSEKSEQILKCVQCAQHFHTIYNNVCVCVAYPFSGQRDQRETAEHKSTIVWKCLSIRGIQ